MSGCPSTSLEVKASSDSLKCVHPEVYHCLRDQVGEKTEKCIKPSWIQKGLCAEYNTIAERLDAKGCQPSRGLCPDKAYLSNDVISYSGCAPTKIKVTTTNTTTSNVNYTKPAGTDNANVIVPVIISLVVICCVVGAVCIIFKRRKRQRTSGKNKGARAPLIVKEEEQKRKEEYLKQEGKKLEFFFEADECAFDSSMECKELDNQIKELSGVILIGKTGSGKTSLAWHLCKTYHGENIKGKECEVIVAKNEELHDNITFSENKRTILLLDDFFETRWDRNSFIKGIPKIKDKFDHDLLLIMTMSDYSFEKMKKIHDCSAILDKCKVIEMEKTLTGFYVMKILEANGIVLDKSKPGDFLKQKQFVKTLGVLNPEESSFPFSNKNTPELGFCLISRLAIRHKTFLNCFESFVQKPIFQITKSVADLRESKEPDDKNKYCTLVYAAMHGGKIDKASMDWDLFNAIGEFHGIGSPSVNTDHYLLRNQRDGAAQFLHKSLFQILFVAFGRKHSAFFIQNCSLNVLLKFSSFTKESNTQDLFYFRFSDKDNRKLLKERIEKSEERIEVNISRDEILQELNSK